ncbi:ORF1079 [White spot syndrome virus]|uniref:ORF1079 n=1 Tax=White spot syndrome virus TaxID=342409 RepID=A0A2D3I5W0_9VIRU|nr:ORF1079 [White spot syndrome virus]
MRAPDFFPLFEERRRTVELFFPARFFIDGLLRLEMRPAVVDLFLLPRRDLVLELRATIFNVSLFLDNNLLFSGYFVMKDCIGLPNL